VQTGRCIYRRSSVVVTAMRSTRLRLEWLGWRQRAGVPCIPTGRRAAIGAANDSDEAQTDNYVALAVDARSFVLTWMTQCQRAHGLQQQQQQQHQRL